MGPSLDKTSVWEVNGISRARPSIGEIKHGAYAGGERKGETFAVCLSCLCSRLKVFVLEVNIRILLFFCV